MPQHASRPSPLHLQNIAAGFRLAIIRPCRHKFAPLFQRITAPISLLGLVADNVRESLLRQLAREVRFVAGPISKGRAEAVRRHVRAHASQNHFERHDR